MTRTGGPAFPRPLAGITEEVGTQGITSDGQEGMTLRDYFAGQALAGLMAHGIDPVEATGILGRTCYAIADALLTYRDK